MGIFPSPVDGEDIMTKNYQALVDSAINQSIADDTIYVMHADDGTQECVEICAELRDACDDWQDVRAVDGTEYRDYWGIDGDGDAWRVQVWPLSTKGQS